MFEKVEYVAQEELDVLDTSEIQECNQHLIDEQVKLIKEKLSIATTEDKSVEITHTIDGIELEFQVRKVLEKAGYVVLSTPIKGDDDKTLYNLSIWHKVE